MANTVNFSVRMDSDIKKQCETLFNELGMNLTTAINIFLRQSIRSGGLPFEVKVEQPNRETIAAMLEAERIARDPSVKHYSDVEEALKCGCDIIMLDNMPVSLMKECVNLIDKRAIVEASGNVKLDTVKEIASTGVDIISTSAIVANARVLDLGLDI